MGAYWSDVILSCRFVVAILSFCRLFLGEQLFLWGISAVAAAFKNKKNAVKAIFCFYGRDDWIRTSDPLHPMQMRYQTALHPDNKKVYKAFREEMQVLFFKNEKQIFYKLWKCKKSRNADANRGKIKKAKF